MKQVTTIDVKAIENKSFNQDQRHEKQGQRYQPIQAKRVAEIFQDHGFQAVSFKSGQAVNPAYNDFQTTSVEFRAPQTMLENTQEAYKVSLTLKSPQLGRGSYQLMLGTYRLICTNGLYVGAAFGVERVKHTGDVENGLSRAIDAILKSSDSMHSVIEKMKLVNLAQPEILQFAKVAAEIRLEDTPNVLQLDSENLTRAQRNLDATNTLWNVFNTVQENVSKYGVGYVQEREMLTVNGPEKRVFNCNTRALKPLANNTIEFNQRLWTVAQDLIGKVG